MSINLKIKKENLADIGLIVVVIMFITYLLTKNYLFVIAEFIGLAIEIYGIMSR